MRIHPAPVVWHLTGVAVLVLCVGLAAQQVAIVAWAGALLVAVTIARTTALISIARVRRAGFEMVWIHSDRVQTLSCNKQIVLEAELRNRDNRAVRYVLLQPVASSSLRVRVEPTSGEIPAAGALRISVAIEARRVGRHAVHGLSLDVQGAPGLFGVPLVFSNPVGVEVLPSPFVSWLYGAKGGRTRRMSDDGRGGVRSGDGTELLELRDHQPGDSFKRIAWRASARRGKLIVRDFERSSRDVVWIVLDASVELWAGEVGKAPLDRGIDDVATIARYHLRRGDKVGVAVIGSTVRGVLQPDDGTKHAHKIAQLLVVATATYDADRSDLDELQVATRVLEHMRPIDGILGKASMSQIAMRAEALLKHALFQAPIPEAPTFREQILRQYLAAFGLDCPARTLAERAETIDTITAFLDDLAAKKASMVHVWAAPPPQPQPQLVAALRKIRRRGGSVYWMSPQHELAPNPDDDAVARAMVSAVSLRAAIASKRGERAVARVGARIQRVRKWQKTP